MGEQTCPCQDSPELLVQRLVQPHPPRILLLFSGPCSLWFAAYQTVVSCRFVFSWDFWELANSAKKLCVFDVSRRYELFSSSYVVMDGYLKSWICLPNLWDCCSDRANANMWDIVTGSSLRFIYTYHLFTGHSIQSHTHLFNYAMLVHNSWDR